MDSFKNLSIGKYLNSLLKFRVRTSGIKERVLVNWDFQQIFNREISDDVLSPDLI